MTKAAQGTKFLKKERPLITLVVISFVILLFTIVFGQATLTSINVEVETLKNKVTTQEEINEVLTMKTDELSSYQKIDAIAKEEGLTYNNSNIKSIY
jgi:cell division protein FtsL